MLAAKRPGTGISPKYATALIGRKAAVTIEEDELITWNKMR
jgi:N-acetylneuraminate synthase